MRKESSFYLKVWSRGLLSFISFLVGELKDFISKYNLKNFIKAKIQEDKEVFNLVHFSFLED